MTLDYILKVINTILEHCPIGDNRPYAKVKVNNNFICGLLHSGSAVTII